jgi:hypothetical protein
MNWEAAIMRQYAALKRIVDMYAMTFDTGPDQVAAAAELAIDRPTLARFRHRALLALVRPAEAAARRLIIALALMVPAAPGAAGPDGTRSEKPDAPGRPPRSRRPRRGLTIVRDGVGTGIVLPRPDSVHRDPFHLVPAHLAPGPMVAVLAPVPVARPPRVLLLPLTDPARRVGRLRRVGPRDLPRIWVAGGRQTPRRPPPLRPDDRVDATRLMLRFEALAVALQDLPREAERFRRWQARNRAAIARADKANAAPMQLQMAHAALIPVPRRVRRYPRYSPLRTGWPPGWRRKSTREIQTILAESNDLALIALRRGDTS